VGILSFIITSIYPALITYSKYLLPETLFLLLFTLSIFYTLKASRELDKRGKKRIIAGILMGLACLTKPVIVLFPPLLILGFLIFSKNPYFKKKLKDTLIITSFFFLTLSCWIARNYLIYHEFVFTTNIGYTFWGSNNILSQGRFVGIRKIDHLKKYQGLREWDRDRIYFKKGLDFIKKQPLYRLIKLSLKKILYLLSPFSPRGYMIFFGIILPLSIIGAFLALKNKESFLLYFIIFYFFLVTVIFYGSIRLRIPLLPYLIIFASSGMVELYHRFTYKFIPASIYFFILIINLYFYYHSEGIKRYLKEVLKFLIK
jgi:4-amino-4-deoxy-L-arabinose transferase-like glycosyltransferase